MYAYTLYYTLNNHQLLYSIPKCIYALHPTYHHFKFTAEENLRVKRSVLSKLLIMLLKLRTESTNMTTNIYEIIIL